MSLQKIIQGWNVAKLRSTLDRVYDTEHSASWKKEKLVRQILTHSVEDILGICTVKELKLGLTLLNLSTSGKKKDLYERLIEGCNDTSKSDTKKATSKKSKKSKKSKTSKTTKSKKTSQKDDSSYASKLQKLFDGDISTIRQGFSLFEALGWEDQEQILKNYPPSKEKRVTHWENKRDLVKKRGEVIIDKEIDNDLINIGFVLHALAEAPQIASVKSMVLWLNNAMNSDFISLLIKCTSLTKLEFRIPLENNQYDSIKADTLISELQNIDKKMTLASRYIPLLEGGFFFDVVEELMLQGESSEKQYPFSEALTKSVKKDGEFVWGNWYNNSRASYSIHTQFSSLKKLSIIDDSILFDIFIAKDLETLEIINLSNLIELHTDAPIKKLILKDVKSLTKIDINTSKIKQYSLTNPLQNGLSPSVNLKKKSAIVTLLKEQKKNQITVTEDATYGFGFIDKWKHLTHDEVWVEMTYYTFSLEHLLKYAKASIQKFFAQENSEEVTIDGSFSAIWSADFGIEDFPFSSGYEMQLHTWGEWKNRWANSDPQMESQLSSHDHSQSTHYERLKEILEDSDLFWNDYMWDEILAFIPKSQFQELEALIEQSSSE
jgi:hypothetical protein